MSQLESTLKAMVACFDSLNIPYAVMGGLAVRVHGLPRPTNDVDFTILLERTRLPEWFRAVQTLGYSVPDQYQTGWVDNVAGMPIVKIRTYLSDGRGVDVDVFLAESDFQRSLIERRVWIELDEDSLWVVSPEDLLLLKQTKLTFTFDPTPRYWSGTAYFLGTTDFQSVEIGWHRRTGSPSYESSSTLILDCPRPLLSSRSPSAPGPAGA